MRKILLFTLGCLFAVSTYSQNRYTTITPTQFKHKSNQDIYMEATANNVSSKKFYVEDSSDLLKASYVDIYSSSSHRTSVSKSLVYEDNYISLVYNIYNKLVGLSINQQNNLHETGETYNLYESSDYVMFGDEKVKVYECKLKSGGFEGDNVFYFSIRADFLECVIFYGAHLTKVFYVDKFELRTKK